MGVLRLGVVLVFFRREWWRGRLWGVGVLSWREEGEGGVIIDLGEGSSYPCSWRVLGEIGD
jgi:hypothetical protein